LEAEEDAINCKFQFFLNLKNRADITREI